MRPVVTDRLAWSVGDLWVCQSVCHSSEPCENSCTDRDAIWVEDSGGPREPCIWSGSKCPYGMGQFWEGEGMAHCKV